MEILRPLFQALCFICAAFSVQAQGFLNLDFESANLPVVPPGQFGGLVPISAALPGWSGYLGTNQASTVLLNSLTLGNPSIDILGPVWTFGGIIEGHHTVVLQPGVGPFGSGENVGATISQQGLVPSYAKSLQIKASAFSSFSVSLGGHNLDLSPIATGQNYRLYGADISSFAGQVGILAITALPAPNTTDSFDSIVFSPSPVPEPSTVGLLLCAGVAFFVARSLLGTQR
jgi:hypothetical protein